MEVLKTSVSLVFGKLTVSEEWIDELTDTND